MPPRGPAKVENVRVAIPGLPDSHRSLRIALLSDLHARRFNAFHRNVAKQANDLEPDIIVIAGDMVNYGARPMKPVVDFLKLLRARLGVFAVRGNWEHKLAIPGDYMRRELAGAGVRLLINENATLDVNGAALSVIGLDDMSTIHHDLALAMKGLPANSLRILVSHAPGIAQYLGGLNIALALSGHTHGGQIRLPFVDPFWLPPRDSGFISGLFEQEGGGVLYVSRGIGAVGVLPIRLNCPPELTLLELQPA